MTFKCIKKYPSIIEIGDIASFDGGENNVFGRRQPSYFIYREGKMITTEWIGYVENFPEYWSKIIKEDNV
jgi:hypothetical protein